VSGARPRADRRRADMHFEKDARDGITLNFDDPAPVELDVSPTGFAQRKPNWRLG